MRNQSTSPRFLLVNPPIYDFAAYDLWLKPLGLLYIASVIKDAGAELTFFDFMDRMHPAASGGGSDPWGCGPFASREVPKPEELKTIPRRYKRHGLPPQAFRAFLERIPTPDAILVTSGMTYWYPGVQEAIREARKRFPGGPIILGGTYATLCSSHAKATSGADHVVPGHDIRSLFLLLKDLRLLPAEAACPARFPDFPPPLYDLYPRLEYAALRTSLGCPFKCTYCASPLLGPTSFEKKEPKQTAREILALAARGVTNIAFYDDALLFDAPRHLVPAIRAVQKGSPASLSFHSPNGLHARYLTPEVAGFLQETGFILPRLSLETSDPKKQQGAGGKVSNGEFAAACGHLLEAGYHRGGYAAYILLGMPGQEFSEVEESIGFAHSLGARVILAEYSPIPGTRDWEEIKDLLPSADPLWHNNSIFPLFPLSAHQRLQEMKDLARELNRDL